MGRARNTCRTFAHEHCFDPGTNTLAGTWYLRKLMRRYAQTDNPLPYALADYNAGRGNVLKWNQGAAVNQQRCVYRANRFSRHPGLCEVSAAPLRALSACFPPGPALNPNQGGRASSRALIFRRGLGSRGRSPSRVRSIP